MAPSVLGVLAPKRFANCKKNTQMLYPKSIAICAFSPPLKRRNARLSLVTDGDVAAPGGLQYVVIDMGSGSIEVIAGRIRQSVPTITDHVSCALGSRRISKQLQDADHDLEAFDSWLEEKLDEVEIPKPGVGAKTILLGSVPTKAVWLQVRPSPFDKYNPQLVGGASIERDAADKLAREILTTWRKDAAMARKFMDSTIKDDSEPRMRAPPNLNNSRNVMKSCSSRLGSLRASHKAIAPQNIVNDSITPIMLRITLGYCTYASPIKLSLIEKAQVL